MARETVEMVPPPACWNDALLTRRSSLCVSATSLRISAARLFDALVVRRGHALDACHGVRQRWKIALVAHAPQQEVQRAVRRRRPRQSPSPAPSQSVQRAGHGRHAVEARRRIARTRARSTMARAGIDGRAPRATPRPLRSCAATRAARRVSTSSARPHSSSPRIMPAAYTSIAGCRRQCPAPPQATCSPACRRRGPRRR